MTTPEPCTNFHGTRRHLSTDLTKSKYRTGREGTSLCSPGGIPVTVDDQEAMDNAGLLYGNPAKRLDDIQECKRCANAAAKLGSAS